MKVIFFNSKTTQQPRWLLLAILLPLVRRVVSQAIFLAALVAIFLTIILRWPLIYAIGLGAGLVLLGSALIGVIGTVHELAHVFAGSRLVGPDYPKALVIPTFQHPFVRFESRQVSPPQIALILLFGSLSGLLVLLPVLIVVLIVPDPGDVRWIWLAYWGALVFPQVASLIPIGDTDGLKVRQLMRQRGVTWFEIGQAAKSLFRA